YRDHGRRCSLYGSADHLVRVFDAQKCAFELRGRQVNSVLQHGPEESRISFSIRLFGRGPIRDWTWIEKGSNDRAHAIHSASNTRIGGGLAEAFLQLASPALELCIWTEFSETSQRRQAGRHRQRIARASSCLIHRSQRRDSFHHLSAPTESSDREPAPDNLSQTGQVRLDAVKLLSAAI